MEGSSVPKFASFHRKPKSLAKPRDSKSEHDEQKRNSRRVHKSHSTHKHHQRSSRDFDTQDGHLEIESDKASRQLDTTAQDREPSNLYFVDRRGDSGIRTYGTNSKASVPDYRTSSERRMLGDQSIARSDASSKSNLLSSLSKGVTSSLMLENENVTPLNISASANVVDLQRDFIPFSTRKKRKRVNFHDSAYEDEVTESHVSYSDGEKSIDHDFSDGENIEQMQRMNQTVTSKDIGLALRQQHASLLHGTKQDPTNLQAWLDYIQFQNKWVRQGPVTGDADLSTTERRSVAEVRISIYKDALGHITKGYKGREVLLLGQLNEGSKVWESRILLERWQKAVTEHPSCLDLQLEYLNLIQTKLSYFSYETCRDQCQNYLRLLHKNQGLGPSQRIERQLYAILRLLSMVRDAGYYELSQCIWQALIEINCLAPSNLQSDFAQRLSEFENFWDAEVARIGEPEARGWKNSSDQTYTPEAGEYIDQQGRATEPSPQDKVSSWLSKENYAMQQSLKPKRTIDEAEDDDDPYKVVLFSDIQHFLFEVPTSHWEHLLNAFLCFNQLPALPGCYSAVQLGWWHDPFLLASRSPVLSAEAALSMPHVLTTSWMLFGVLQSRLSGSGDDLETKRSQFARNVFRTLVQGNVAKHALAEYCLAIEAAIDSAKARKIGKTMLKQDPTDLRLYNAYGLIESRLGNDEASNHVFSTAITMVSSLEPKTAQLDVLLLQRSWIWQALSKNDTPTASKRLSTITATSMSDDIELILHDKRDMAIQLSLPESAATASELVALNAYLNSGSSSSNLAVAMDVCSKELVYLQTFDVYNLSAHSVECLFQAQAALITHHMRHHAFFSPGLIRSTLRDPLARFPGNTMFLDLYAENEQRFRIHDRVRQIANEILRAGPEDNNEAQRHGVIALCFAIKSELLRGKLAASGSTAHSVRAAFEKAVTNDAKIEYTLDLQREVYRAPPSASIVLWTAYLLWEVEIATITNSNRSSDQKPSDLDARREGSKYKKSKDQATQDPLRAQLQRAKQIWVRGINALPWAKSFVMLGLEILRDCLSLYEVQGYVNMMTDNGLRVHCEFESMPS